MTPFLRKVLNPFTISLFVFLLSILAIIYSLFAGLWGFNPTDIDWFNTKLLITSTLMCFISSISVLITTRFT